jgi:hypothetical protein
MIVHLVLKAFWFVKKHEQLTENTKLKIRFKKLHLKIFFIWMEAISWRAKLTWNDPLFWSRFEHFKAIQFVPGFMFLTVNVKVVLKKMSPTLFISPKKEPPCFLFSVHNQKIIAWNQIVHAWIELAEFNVFTGFDSSWLVHPRWGMKEKHFTSKRHKLTSFLVVQCLESATTKKTNNSFSITDCFRLLPITRSNRALMTSTVQKRLSLL